MKKIVLYLAICIISFSAAAQNTNCQCGNDPLTEFGNITSAYKDSDDNEKAYRWYVIYTTAEGVCLPNNYFSKDAPKIEKVILDALHNDTTYKNLLAALVEDDKVILKDISLAWGGFGPSGSILSEHIKNYTDVLIPLKVDLSQFVDSYAKCE